MNAKTPGLLTATLRVTRVRVRSAKLCVLFGHRVDLETNHNDRSQTFDVDIVGCRHSCQRCRS